MRDLLELEMKEMNHALIRMVTLIEKTLDDTLQALVKQDKSMARQVVEGDDVFDDMQRLIENRCVMIIATQQPVASDLRAIFSAAKIVTDLERIADHCQDIARITLKLTEEKYVKPLVNLPKMAIEVKAMLRQTIDCYVNQDAELAQRVCENDDVVDEYFEIIYRDLKEIMKTNADVVDQCMNFLMIAKYLERMADHTTNIAEWVIYNVRGAVKLK